ncbi:hypothetical protein [Nocardioides okcheonensis]|uniref:hypothetical protein n=1 Tax=Nocardioides okcheonensis TaxID=2894081 RepID=UPI001E28CBF2|nr:hypothetical protein [Nocardioides okcheonensis]UFN44720.1 hypothetical protein LN652_00390 [Nocardioides okcheonensis]
MPEVSTPHIDVIECAGTACAGAPGSIVVSTGIERPAALSKLTGTRRFSGEATKYATR